MDDHWFLAFLKWMWTNQGPAVPELCSSRLRCLPLGPGGRLVCTVIMMIYDDHVDDDDDDVLIKIQSIPTLKSSNYTLFRGYSVAADKSSGCTPVGGTWFHTRSRLMCRPCRGVGEVRQWLHDLVPGGTLVSLEAGLVGLLGLGVCGVGVSRSPTV